MRDRRDFLKASAGGLLLAQGMRCNTMAAAADLPARQSLPGGALDAAALESLPGKLPLIRKSLDRKSVG